MSQIAVKLHDEQGASRMPVSYYSEIAKLELLSFKVMQVYSFVYCHVLDGIVICTLHGEAKPRGRVPVKENYSFEICIL